MSGRCPAPVRAPGGILRCPVADRYCRLRAHRRWDRLAPVLELVWRIRPWWPNALGRAQDRGLAHTCPTVLPCRVCEAATPREVPRPSDRRTTAGQLQVGDTVFVWAHDSAGLSTPCSHDMWRYGKVTDLRTASGVLRPLAITLDDQDPVHTVPHAVAYVVAGDVITRPLPGDDPQPAPELPADRKQAIKVAAIRPDMDVTVKPASEIRYDPDAGMWWVTPVRDRTERGQVITTSRTGDLVMLHLWDGTDEDRGHGRWVYVNANRDAVLHLSEEVTAP